MWEICMGLKKLTNGMYGRWNNFIGFRYEGYEDDEVYGGGSWDLVKEKLNCFF